MRSDVKNQISRHNFVVFHDVVTSSARDVGFSFSIRWI